MSNKIGTINHKVKSMVNITSKDPKRGKNRVNPTSQGQTALRTNKNRDHPSDPTAREILATSGNRCRHLFYTSKFPP